MLFVVHSEIVTGISILLSRSKISYNRTASAGAGFLVFHPEQLNASEFQTPPLRLVR
jgi:hypothetical protein